MPLTPDRLRRLVRQREQLETLQEGRLGKALGQKAQRELAVRESQTARTSFFVEARGTGEGIVDPTLLAAGRAYSIRLDRDIAARKSALAHSETDVEIERDRLLDRRRDRRAMETLLEKWLAECKVAANRTQAKRLDEQATVRWLNQPTSKRAQVQINQTTELHHPHQLDRGTL